VVVLPKTQGGAPFWGKTTSRPKRGWLFNIPRAQRPRLGTFLKKGFFKRGVFPKRPLYWALPLGPFLGKNGFPGFFPGFGGVCLKIPEKSFGRRS